MSMQPPTVSVPSPCPSTCTVTGLPRGTWGTWGQSKDTRTPKPRVDHALPRPPHPTFPTSYYVPSYHVSISHPTRSRYIPYVLTSPMSCHVPPRPHLQLLLQRLQPWLQRHLSATSPPPGTPRPGEPQVQPRCAPVTPLQPHLGQRLQGHHRVLQEHQTGWGHSHQRGHRRSSPLHTEAHRGLRAPPPPEWSGSHLHNCSAAGATVPPSQPRRCHGSAAVPEGRKPSPPLWLQGHQMARRSHGHLHGDGVTGGSYGVMGGPMGSWGPRVGAENGFEEEFEELL